MEASLAYAIENQKHYESLVYILHFKLASYMGTLLALWFASVCFLAYCTNK